MINIDTNLSAEALLPKLDQFFSLAGDKIRLLDSEWDTRQGSPVFTIDGKYTTRGWTEWTQGFQFGCALLQFDAEDNEEFLDLGRQRTIDLMAPHLTHTGVHDHGFNNVSTYGNLLRLINEGRISADDWEKRFYELAIKVSGAVQASRWTDLPDGLGYVYSFNGPHSLFSDTIRSMRAVVWSHALGHVLQGEHDEVHNLLGRALKHAESTARYNVYFGDGRDSYDEYGRVVHESIFNLNDGQYRCPSTQQGYSPFTTWTRGQAWVLSGYPEQLEFLQEVPEAEFESLNLPFFPDKAAAIDRLRQVAIATAEHFINETPTDGIPYWDTGAPGLANLVDYQYRPAEPYNDFEPVDSSAAAISAQGLIRLGTVLESMGEIDANRYLQAGLTVASRLFEEPYLSTDPKHHGLLLHSVYHRPNGWDHVPDGQSIPCNESTLWGDYHGMELALLIKRMASDGYHRFASWRDD
jgi:hypothetical protein